MIKNVFGKGKSTYGKGSSRLNLPSHSIDRRKKENEAYRSSRCKSGELVQEDGKYFVIFDDGRKEVLDIEPK